MDIERTALRLASGFLLVTAVLLWFGFVRLEVPISTSCLKVDNIDLGKVQPASQLPVQLRVRNQCNQAIRLAPPLTDCGCMTLDAPSVRAIEGGGEMLYKFSLRPPSELGKFQRRVTIRSVDDETLIWAASIDGTVDAQFWTIPSSLSFVLCPDEHRGETLEIHHDVDIDDVKSPFVPDELELDYQTGATKDVSFVQIKLRPDHLKDPFGSVNLTFEGTKGGKKYSVVVPVSWSQCPAFRFAPVQISLSDCKKENNELIGKVLLFSRRELAAGKIQLKPLEPWVRVLDTKTVTNTCFEVTVAFNIEKLPRPVDHKVLCAMTESGVGQSYLRVWDLNIEQ